MGERKMTSVVVPFTSNQ